MKKILSLLVLLVAFTSCEEDIRFNNPAVQGLKDNELWRASDFKAIRGVDNSLTIEATNGYEILVLKVASTDPGVYSLGQNETNKASFVLSADGIEMAYQTGANLGDGEIEISNKPSETDLVRGFISGKFRFNAIGTGGTAVNFQEGVFYKVPVMAVQ